MKTDSWYIPVVAVVLLFICTALAFNAVKRFVDGMPPIEPMVHVVSDSALYETIVAQRDTIIALRRCIGQLREGVEYPICTP
ncbi:MAG: hypothetical protein AMS20_00115 [Gemmatimonas sp. SG8_28]|nr:MAG: hypothetical protein AMS20_00115 [Gemmatimonas sp. SG8_28]